MPNVLEMDQKKQIDPNVLKARLHQLAWELQQAVDMTIEIRRESPQCKQETIVIWEEFLGSFFGHIKLRSKESKENLLSGISLTRLKIF